MTSTKTLHAPGKANLEPNTVSELSQAFHQVLREYSKAIKHWRRALNASRATKSVLEISGVSLKRPWKIVVILIQLS